MEKSFPGENSFRNILVKSAQTSTMHALPNIFNNDSWLIKLVWILSLAICSSLAAFLVYMSLTSFLDYEIVTKSYYSYESPLDFPTVTICNLNQYNTNDSIEFIKLVFQKANITDLEQLENLVAQPMHYKVLFLRTIIETNVIKMNLSDEMKKSLGFSLDNILISCYFNFEPCNSSDFEWYYNSVYGNCFRFNSGNIQKKTIKGGKWNGLRVELYIDEPDSIYTSGYSYGAHVAITNKTIANGDLLGIEVATGFETNILVDRVFSQKLPEPYNECQTLENIQNKEVLNAFLRLGASYNQQDCLGICYQIHLIRTCKCWDPTFLYVNTSYGPCITVEEMDCDFKVYSTIFKDNVKEKCPDCTLECESWRYHLSTTFANYPTKLYAQQLKNNSILRSKSKDIELVSYEELKNRILFLNIFYDELKYASIVEIPKTSWLDLIAGIGGTLGLFIGVSFLSFLEVVDILIKIILFKLNKHQSTIFAI